MCSRFRCAKRGREMDWLVMHRPQGDGYNYRVTA
jgi:hypothetical protein